MIASYDAIAAPYAEHFFDELDGKPWDRAWLDRFALTVAGRGRVCDLGCGPGQIARYLATRGVDVFGVDASAAMVTTARSLNASLTFQQGDFFALDLPDGGLAGIAAFYSLIHCARGELGRALGEIVRVLMPNGRLLLAVHDGVGEVTREELFDTPVAFFATLFSEAEIRAALTAAGLVVDELATRPPYDFEYPSHRIYASCTRP